MSHHTLAATGDAELTASANDLSIDHFLVRASSRTAPDLSVTCTWWLGRYRDLTVLDLSPLTHLTCIGDSFLCGCGALTALDLSPLAHVTSIGDSFLWGCDALTALDLSLLAHLTCIGDSFLRGCGRCFLDGCRGLPTIDLSPMERVTSIGSWFVDCCSELTGLHLSPMERVTNIGEGFLDDCKRLANVSIIFSPTQLVLSRKGARGAPRTRARSGEPRGRQK